MSKVRERMIALGMCFVLAASSLSLGESGGILKVQAAEAKEVPKVLEKTGENEKSRVSESSVSDGLMQESKDVLEEEILKSPEFIKVDEPMQNEVELQAEPRKAETVVEEDGAIIIDEAHFPDKYLRQYLLGELDGYENICIDSDKDGKLSMVERYAVSYISIYGKPIRNLMGISYFPNLARLTVEDSLIESADLSGNEKLVYVSLDSNQKLESIDLSGSSKLKDLSLYKCMISELDVSNCTQLERLDCDNNQLCFLGVSNCTELRSLSCTNNQLQSLNLNGCTQLNYLNCAYNKLKLLDLNQIVQMKNLYVSNNQFTELDLHDLTKLAYLRCSRNLLSVLDVSNNLELIELDCDNNQLDSLDIARLGKLNSLECYENQIIELDITGNAELMTLRCGGNPLKKLDISCNPKLKSLDIDDTYITSLDASANELLRLGSYDSWETRYITGIIEEIEDGGWLFDLSSQEGFQPDKLSISSSNLEGGNNAPELTEQGVVWKEDPVGEGELYLTLAYDLSNNGYLDGKVMYCRYKLQKAGLGYDETYIDLTEENFPDNEFRSYLKGQYDRDNDGKFQPGTISSLSISWMEGLKDLTGIGYFTSLTRLSLYHNPALAKLDVGKNRALASLAIDGTPIHYLDLRNNPNMKNISLSSNVPLVSLYLAEECPVSSWFNTQPIEVTAVEENGRYVLDLTKYGGLDQKRIVGLSDGQIEGNKIYWDSEEEIPTVLSYKFILRSDYKEGVEYTDDNILTVNFSLTNNAPELPKGSMVALTEENFPSAQLLKYLAENYDWDKDGMLNTRDVSSLSFGGDGLTDLSGIEKLDCLKSIYIWGAAVRALDLSANRMLTSLQLRDGSLTEVNISGCPYLETVDLDGNSLAGLDFSQNKMLRSLSLNGNSLTNLDVGKNKKLVSLNVYNNSLRRLDLSGNNKLQSLNCSDNPKMDALELPEEKLNITEINIRGNSLSSLPTEQMPNLISLGIDNNQGKITEIDLKNNTKLKSLTANGISLNVDWTKLTALEYLGLYDRRDECMLEILDLSKAVNLRTCHVDVEALKELDLHGCSQLDWLFLYGGKLRTLNVSNCKILSGLSCTGSRLSSLNVSGCTALASLNCENNELPSLDLSSCSALKELRCNNNRLEILDITNNGALQTLDCSLNKLTTIDTSKNFSLKWFYCSDNPITKLDLSENKAILTDLSSYRTSLTSLDVEGNKELENVQLEDQVFVVPDGVLQPETAITNVLEPVALQGQARENQNVNVGDKEVYILRLGNYGKFDPTKVKSLSSGKAVEGGIVWESKEEIPDRVNYEYDLSNNYKLSGCTMPVTLVMDGDESQIPGADDDSVPDDPGCWPDEPEKPVEDIEEVPGDDVQQWEPEVPEGGIEDIPEDDGKPWIPEGEIGDSPMVPTLPWIPEKSVKKEISSCSITVNANSPVYNQFAHEPEVTVRQGKYILQNGTDYYVTYENNVNAGKATVTITGMGDYAGSAQRNFTIEKAKQRLHYWDHYQMPYGSKAFSLDIFMENGNGKLIYKSSDRKVATVNGSGKVTPKGVGVATITVKVDSRNYKAASVKIKVIIEPAKVAIKSLKAENGKKLVVKWKKDAKATGYLVQYSTDKKFKRGVKQKTVSKNKTASCTLTKLKQGKKYYVRIRAYKAIKVNGKKQMLKGDWAEAKRSREIKK